jgi:hypothetical protein
MVPLKIKNLTLDVDFCEIRLFYKVSHHIVHLPIDNI